MIKLTRQHLDQAGELLDADKGAEAILDDELRFLKSVNQQLVEKRAPDDQDAEAPDGQVKASKDGLEFEFDGGIPGQAVEDAVHRAMDRVVMGMVAKGLREEDSKDAAISFDQAD